jgi:hypothetical protein
MAYVVTFVVGAIVGAVGLVLFVLAKSSVE